MDERHWWFATKLQETFHIGALDNPTMLEDFMAEQSTLDYINDFLAPEGHKKLFFTCPKPDPNSLTTRKMTVSSSCTKLKDVMDENAVCLYFIRSNVNRVIDPTCVEKEVFCGEIKENPLVNFSSLLSGVFAPVLHAQKDWGQCSEEEHHHFLNQIDKYTNTLVEYANATIAPQQILKKPDQQVNTDFKQNRAAAVNPVILQEYENLVLDWISTIESILMDGFEDRPDINAGPLSELDKWKRRQKILVSVTDQLRGKECKAVIAVMITAKSKVLKRWKAIDSSITDALNETKDKVRYLESLRKYLDQLYSGVPLSTICSTTLPGLMASIRQMDAVSRYYARNGYLGLLFSKISNQLVITAKKYLRGSTMVGDDDQLWKRVHEEVDVCASGTTTTVAVPVKTKPSKKKGAKDAPSEDGFMARLMVCLSLQKQYRDMLRSLRDSLGGSHSLSQVTSVTPTTNKRSVMTGSNLNLISPSTLSPNKMLVSQSMRFRSDHESVTSQGSSGIAFTDEESIMGYLEIFCIHVRNMIDIIQTLGQLSKVASDVKNLIRIPNDVVINGVPEGDITDQIAIKGTDMVQNLPVADTTSKNPSSITGSSELSYSIEDSLTTSRNNGLGNILEGIDEEEQIEEIYQVEVIPSIASIITDTIQTGMQGPLESAVTTTTFLDVEGKGREVFEQCYTGFVASVHKTENYICNYLKGLFSTKLNIRNALIHLTSFNSVINRSGLRAVLSEKFLEVFSWFENELEEVQKIYEAEKESPPLVRNSPMVAGAITWSRNLLRRIEEPMKIFKENKFITSYRDFNRIVRFYNRIATALVKFENLWLSLWKSRIDSACVGLKATLLAKHPSTHQLIVNADGRIFELIHESKSLLRLGIQLPESAAEILKQDSRLKKYKQSLELILQDYYQVCSSVPAPLTRLLTPHMESVLHYLQPGLSTLNWNSMNIDAYLHQVHTATDRLRDIVDNINQVIRDGVEKKIKRIAKIILFDPNLAYSKIWTVDKFVEVEGRAVRGQAKGLYDLVKEVENALQEIVAISQQRRITSLGSPILTPTPSTSYGMDNLGPSTPRLSKLGTMLSSASLTRGPTAVSGLTDESVIGDIFGHYCSMVFDGVLASIVSSLMIFGDSVKPLGRLTSGIQVSQDSSSLQDLDNDDLSDFGDCVASSSIRPSPKQQELLKFEVQIRFNIPDIVIEPSLSTIQDGVNKIATDLVDVSKSIMWWAADVNESFHGLLSKNDKVQNQLQELSAVVTSLQDTVDRQLLKFRRYDFLWKDDMHALYHSFVEGDPGTDRFKEEVENLQRIEENVLSIPDRLTIGSVSLTTSPIKDSLHGFAVAWKLRYSTQLHEEAKIELDKIVSHRNDIYERLSKPVITLDELNSAFQLLQQLGDMENTIDDVYLPVENIYDKLREYKLNLPRKEVEEVDNLREEWTKLIELAEAVRTELLVKKRSMFEQELDKEVKAFVVNVIQFRNSFDTQGPGIPSVRPAEAVIRLQDFQQRYTQYEANRKTLDSVQLLFGIIPTPFPELDKTGEELKLLGQLYGLFQQYISFDQRFRDTLWSEVDLIVANQEMEHYWQECTRLPPRIQGWEAYKEMRDAIQEYLHVFPILHRLNSKEIRNRHWLQVMSVTGSSFQLEAHIFKLVHLLDIGLLEHQNEIQNICRSASRELELEMKMRSIEEEWTEQVLSFENFKNRGLVCLSHSNTENLLDVLEDAQATLAMMLTSRHIGPLRDEAAAWALKLKEICEVLEQWLTVQDLWKHLEEVFSNSATAKELPQEYNRFARVDKSYMKMMKRAYETKNVLQCCVGGDVPKIQMLKHLHEELEICFKSLVGFLDSKRKVFPRFCFVTDTVLLAILSKPHNLESLKPYLRCLFSGVTDVSLIQVAPEPAAPKKNLFLSSATQWNKPRVREDSGSFSMSKDEGRSLKPFDAAIIKESDGIMHRSSVMHSSLELRDVDWRSTIPQNIATAVSSDVGETVQLKTQVPLTSSVDVWLSALLKGIHDSLYWDIKECINDIDASQSIEEWAGKYPAQVCRLGLLYVWTRECEAGIADIRIDRKALPNATKRFWSGLTKLPNLLARGSWKHSDGPMPAYHKLRLETLLSQGMFLRDILDDLGRRKLRDVVDFEWKRNIRFYGTGSSKAIGLPLATEDKDQSESNEPTVTEDKDSPSDPFVIHMLDAQLPYDCEFYGDEGGLVLTPITERCFLTLTQSIWNFYGGTLQGPTDTGKTETIKGLAYLLGRYLVTLSCSPRMAASGIGKIIVGLAEEGCWGLMDEFHQVNKEVVSVMLYEIQAVLLAMRAGISTCTIDDSKEINVNQNFSVFLTVSMNGERQQLPPEVKAFFRSVAMVVPDVSLVLRAHCAGQGFKSHKVIADRLKLVTDICSQQLGGSFHHKLSLSSLVSVIHHAGQKRASQGPMGAKLSTNPVDYGRPSSTQSVIPGAKDRGGFGQQKDKKPGTPSALSSAAKLEHAYIVQSLIECIGPRLTPDEMNVFNSILRDVFYGLPRPPAQPYHVTKELEDFEGVLLHYTKDKGLVTHHQWIVKINQLRNLSKIHHGIIVAGPPGTGKSTCISALIDTLTECSNIKHKNTGSPIHSHKQQKIYPLGVSDPAIMFGRINSSGDFEDGIFTAYWRKANKEHSVLQMTTWICLDAPLHHGWAETLNSVLDQGEYLNLLNGERLYLSEHLKIIFETDDLRNASPATVSRSAIVFMDESVLGWRPLAEAWLANRSPQEIHCLQRAFNKTVDAISQFVQFEARPRVKICEVGLFSTCLAMLKALIEGNTDIGGELHIERLYLFSLIWSFGSLLDEQDRKRFSEILLSLTTALPDYDQEISVFDYYVDESGEWDPWQSKLPDLSYLDAADLLGEVFVETVNTVRTRMFMELVSASGRNILVTGPTGCGKTSLINDFLDKQEDKNQIVKRYVFSGTSKAVNLQRFVENNIHHRQGFVYGAKKGKGLNVFIDDLSIPQQDQHGVQEVNELLRQVLDQGVLFNTVKPFDRRVLEGVVVTAAMGVSSETSERIPERLKRHFATFHLPALTTESLFTIVNSVLEANMAQNQGMGLPQDFHELIVKASCSFLEKIQDVLRPSCTPGRFHYQFNLRDLTRVFQGLKNCSEEMRADEDYIVSLWQHEMFRVMKDRIPRVADNIWFEKNMMTVIKEYFPSLPANTPPPLFITFPLDPASYTSRPVTQARTSVPKNTLQVIDSIDDVSQCLQNYLRRYSDEFNEGLDIMVSHHVMYHVVRVHRVLSYKNRGNVLLVGAIGAHLASLARLALYMLDYHIHPVDCSSSNTFLDGLRSAVRQAGCDGKTTTVLFTGPDLKDDTYFDALNSLLISGEYPPLFSEDELESLLQALMPAIKRKFSSFLADPMKFFITRVKANLHVVLCLPPTHKLLRVGSSSFPGILYGCQMNWIKDWPSYALEGQASHYLAKYSVLEGIDEQSRQKVVSSLSTIHAHVLRECHQIPWAGLDQTIRPTSGATDIDPNLPLSKNILLERINLKHQSSDGTALGKIAVGPTTYMQYLHCFRHIFKEKRREAKIQVDKLGRALSTLDQTRKDAIVIKEVISETKQKLEVAKEKSYDLLKALTNKATSLEKLKAKLGIGSSTLSAFTALIDNEIDEDDHDLLYDDEEDELDQEFEKIKNAKMKSRRIKVMEQITSAEGALEEAKVQLRKGEQNVNRWQNKVDRSLCERLRAFQSPPPMTGMVMVMTMVLLGRPEFASGIGGAGSFHTTSSRERKGGESLAGGSDEMSRASSATMRRRGFKEQPKGSPSQGNLHGVSSEGKVDRASWKAIQQIMNDSQKFVESLHNVNWKGGLPDDILSGVQSFLVTSSGGELGVSDGDLGSAAAGASASNYAVSSSPTGRASITSGERKAQGVTLAAAKYSSEDAAVLVEYIISLVEYTRLYKPYKKAQEFLEDLIKEKEEDEKRAELEQLKQDAPSRDDAEPEPEEELTEADLLGLQQDVQRLQKEFDDAVVIKHNLENDVKSCSERLKEATDLLHSLKHIEKEWKAYVQEYSSPEILLANCIAAAAFLTYCGAMGIDQRKRMGKYFMQVCRENGMNIQARHLFSRFTLAELLKGKITLKKWENMNLPTDPWSLDNMCIASQEESSDTWPFLCDPQRIAITWINTMLGQASTVKYKELRGHLETSLMEGTTLLITDVDVNSLVNDNRFYHILRSRYRFLTSVSPFKLMIGEHEIECQPGFRLVFATTSPAEDVPPGLSAYVNVVEFVQSRDGLEEMFLDRFFRLEKPRMQETRTQVITEMVSLMEGLRDAEENILSCLGSGHRLLYNLTATKKLASIKRLYDETLESQMRCRGIENSILQSREGYRPIARRAAVMFDVSRVMAEINPAYQTSLSQFLVVFDAAITHSERTAVKAVVERLGYSAFCTTARSLFEQDRPIFTILTALEVEDSANRISAGDREFLIHPTFGATVKTALNPNLAADSVSRSQGKKPFDWMHDEQYANLQLLAQHFEWFQEPFDKMAKDGRETQWRQITEHEKPELVALPDGLDDKYTPIQRLMVVRALRGDRLLPASTCFITSVLGKRYTGELSLDLPAAYRQSDCRRPIVLLYTREANMVERIVIDAAQRKQVELHVVGLTNVGSNEERMARKLIHKAMVQGSWVLLHNAHNTPRLLGVLDSFMQETKTVDPEFRLWVSVQPKLDIPFSLLHTAVKIVTDSPQNTKDSLLRSMSWVDNELLRVSNRAEWPAVLHNICMVHSAVKLRTRFKLVGWNNPKDFRDIGTGELWQALDLAVKEFQDTADLSAAGGNTRSIQWNGLRYMLAEVVYGSSVSDEFDRQALSSIIDYWISPAAVKREFEAAKTKYKLPQALFGNHIRASTVLSAMESIAADILEIPEACGLHSSLETHLPDHQYVFTRLNLLFDRMAASDSLTHAVSDPSSLTPTSGVIVQSSSSQAIGAGALCLLEAGVFASASMVAMRSRKDVELNELCVTMLSKLPKAWNRESVYERMKKAGGANPFNLFILAEVDCMLRLLAAVRQTLMAIKLATDNGVHGDRLTEKLLQAADDLHHSRIPAKWIELSGEVCPPYTWSISSWFTDLSSRFSHIDRIVVQGRDRVPAYWLGAFFNPRRLLSVIKQETVRHFEGKASGNEPYVFQTEITGRDKDHLREPPLEGIFVYGVYLWGCAWEKTTGDLLDAPPKYGPTPLPVVHITVVPQGDKASVNDPVRAAVSYSCPCYPSRISSREPVLLMDVDNKDITGTRWPLRGLSCTLRPF